MLKLVVNRDLCEVNAICTGYAPDVFGVDEQDRMAVLVEHPGPERLDDVRAAVRCCPRGALSLVEEP